MADTKKKLEAIPTIDVSLIVIRTGTSGNYVEYAVDTSNKLGVEPQTETTDAIKLVKLNRIIAQKPQRTVITGHQLTLTDNVFSPTLAKILQGGEISGSLETDDFTYTPPVSGSDDKGEVFELDAYSAQYDASGQIVRYEKTTYPNCQGTPFTESMEDDVFRVSEYTINSAPKTGEAPYKRTYVNELPDFSSVTVAQSVENGMPVAYSSGTEETGISVK